MIDLPAALAPWSHWLARFPHDVAEALGPLVVRLSMAMGPFNARDVDGAGDPDGFDGLARRGSYERLLLSEWALADISGDEFLRRASQGEHGFLKVARRAPASARTSVALFDAGPDQIGAPRIVHLAALVALGRRAEAARASFGWGILQRRDTSLVPGVLGASIVGIMAMLSARTPFPPSSEDLGHWLEQSRGRPAWDDVWIVSSKRLRLGGEWRGVARLEVDEVIAPGPKRVGTRLTSRTGSLRELALDMPDDRTCARLLRDPYAVATTALVRRPAALATASNLIFARNGTKLLYRSPKGGIISVPIPNSPRAPQGRPRAYVVARGEVVAGACWYRGVVTAVAYEHALVVRSDRPQSMFGGRRQASFSLDSGAFSLPTSEEARLESMFFLSDSFYLADRTGKLFRLRITRTAPELVTEATVVAEEVAAVGQFPRGLVFVGRGVQGSVGQGHASWRLVTLTEGGEEWWHLFHGGGSLQTFFGPTPGHASPGFGVIAVEEEPSRFVIRQHNQQRTVPVPPRMRIVGLTTSPILRDPSLVAIDDGGTQIALVAEDGVRIIKRTESAIENITVCPSSHLVAYTTRHRELTVLSLMTQEPLVRAHYEGAT